jgi:beta-glucosidase
LLTDILRGEWGFDGFVHSDWVMGVYKPYGASAGLDIENPEPQVFGEKLIASVQDGTTEPHVIDQACRRILRVLYRFASAEDPLEDYPQSLVASAGHVAVALEAAEKSAVLLTNDGSLPLNRASIKRLAVLGQLAALENTGDNGSSRVRAPYVVTALEGLRQYVGDDVIISGDETDLASARTVAQSADAVIVVVGNTAEDEGEYIPGDIALGQAGSDDAAAEALRIARESRPAKTQAIGGDRIDLGLRADQLALIDAAVASSKPVIVVLVSGSAIMVEGWHDKVSAILQTFYSGMEGGTALARLLFGDVSPSGKLPFTVASSVSHYPPFDRDADSMTYGYYHGYALMDRAGHSPRFAYGHGLSYTKFAYRALNANVVGDQVQLRVAVRNDGPMAADEIVQAYVGFPGQVAERPAKSLKAFQRVIIAAGETKIVRLAIPVANLAWRNPVTHAWDVETGNYTLMVGGSSDNLIRTVFTL